MTKIEMLNLKIVISPLKIFKLREKLHLGISIGWIAAV
jgi:hypothetical protein